MHSSSGDTACGHGALLLLSNSGCTLQSYAHTYPGVTWFLSSSRMQDHCVSIHSLASIVLSGVCMYDILFIPARAPLGLAMVVACPSATAVDVVLANDTLKQLQRQPAHHTGA